MPLARPPTEVMVKYIDENRDKFGVEPICTTLQVASSTYYDHKQRPPSPRQVRDELMMTILMALWVANRKVYGAHKLWKAARRAGHDIGRDQTARLMKLLGIGGVTRQCRVRTTKPDPEGRRPADLVDRQFTATAPNRLWVVDLTYVGTWQGVAYVCFLTDVFSRRIVGWRVAAHMRAEMVTDALEMARWNRSTRFPDPGTPQTVGNGSFDESTHQLVCHSDAGSQFTSVRWGEHLADLGAVPSIGSVGDSYDNALAETVNGIYKTELIRGPDHGPWKTIDQVELATLSWVHWYNTQRLHGYCADTPPSEYEEAHYAQQQLTSTLFENQ